MDIDIKIKKEPIFEIILFFYIFNMVLEESNYALINVIGEILSISRFLILIVLLILILEAGVKMNDNSLFTISIFIIFSLLNMVCSGGGIRFSIILLLILYSRGVPLEKIFKASIKSLVFSIVFVISSSLLGIIQDTINTRVVAKTAGAILTGDYIRHSGGFLMSNQIPFFLFYLYAYAIVLYKERMKIKGHLAFQLLNLVVFEYCGSRTMFLLTGLIAVVFLLTKLLSKCVILYKNTLKKMSILVFPIFCLFCFIGTYLFGMNLLNPVNIVFNFRFSNMYETIKYYGIHLIGNPSTVGTTESLNGVVVDNGYLMLFLQKGLVIGVVVISIWVWLTYISVKKENNYFLIFLAIFAVANVIDYHFISYRNIPFFCILTHADDILLKCNLKRNDICKRRELLHD